MDLSYAHASPHYLFSRTNTMPQGYSGPPGAYGIHSGKDRNASAGVANAQHHNRLANSQDNTGSNYSLQSEPSSRSSGATAGTSASTLFQAAPPSIPSHMSGVTTNGGDVARTDNVMNSVADASSSLFQVCVSLRQRLYGVPGFRQILEEEEDAADEDTDPVTLLWRTFRQGFPLMDLYNALRPTVRLELGPGVKADKIGKASTFKFLQACVNELKFPQEECFIITDLYGDDTTGFAKVTRVVRRVLDILVQRDLIDDLRPTESDFEEAAKGIKRTQRQHIVAELVTTERTYVQHLELLQAFKHRVEEKGIIPGDAVHDIFLNLNSLLDFQRRFLIKVEQTNSLPEDEQNWGNIFVLYCEAFKVYEPYIANQKKCEKTVVAEFNKLREAGGSTEMRQMVESPTALYGFLMKPFQRLSKYPLLLEDLYKKGDLDDKRKSDLMNGKEAATSILIRTNYAVDREEKAEAVQELKVRVEDWKGHRVEGFGELLLYGTFTVVKGEGAPAGSKEGERQYHVYLFETILLCCKDIDLSKPKNKLSNKQLVDKRGKPKLQLKGRIFMQNVTDLISLCKQGKAASVSWLSEFWQLTIQTNEWIFWKSDPSIDNFVIRFPTEEMMKKWASQIEVQRKKYGPRDSRSSHGSHRAGTSQTEFEFMRNQTGLENPYTRPEDEDDDEDAETLVGSGYPSSGFAAGPYGRDVSQSRNGSQSSLRSRSTTGESSMIGGAAPVSSTRAPAPRFPPGSMPSQPPLSVRTRELQGHASSPGLETVGESYFSPVGETPNSSRTSSSSQHMYPFPQQPMPPGQYYQEGQGHTRFTAPAIARQRQPSGGGPPNGYSPNDQRGPPPGPARPGPGTLHSAQNMPNSHRNRSASSPDIHNNGAPPRSVPRGPGQPPVPDMPATYQQNPHMIPRSQSNSPNLQNGGMPPHAQRSIHNTSPQYERQRPGPPRMQSERYPPQDPSPTGYGHQPPYGRHGSRGDIYQPGHVSQGSLSRGGTPQPNGRDIYSPPMQQQHFQHQPPPPTPSLPHDPSGPTQLKIKVRCPSASQTLTLVVPMNISYQSLKDRIDAKLQRSTNLSLTRGGEGLVKLKYADSDGDLVSIQSDEDVQTAFEAWGEENEGEGGGRDEGGMGEIELFCQ